MMNTALRGKPDAGNPHVAPTRDYGGTSRFDEGEVAPGNPRRGSLLYTFVGKNLTLVVACCATMGAFGEILLADPSIVKDGGHYYLVGTENGLGETPNAKVSGQAVFPLYVSDDLYTWRLARTPLGEGRLLAKADAFGHKWYWAPQLVRHGDRWYFAYTSECRWSIAAADRPEGPFKTVMTYPSKTFAIDPAIFFDDDGRVYCYFAGGGIRAIELTSDLTSCIGTNAIRCIVNDQSWERKPLAKRYVDLNAKFAYAEWRAFRASPVTVEGPSVVKRCGKYVLFYSANDFRSPDYCVGVAVADCPLGPWKKLQNAAVISNEHTGLNGTGHGDVFTAADGSLWYVFHAHNSSIRIDPRRTGAILLKETLDADGYPRYTCEPATMRLF